MNHNEPIDHELAVLFEAKHPVDDSEFTKQTMRLIQAEEGKFRLLKRFILVLGMALVYMVSIAVMPYLNLLAQEMLGIVVLSFPGWWIVAAAIVYFGFSGSLECIKGIREPLS